jgi:hypothetical protein
VITYIVTWYNANTNTYPAIKGKAQSIESARAEEERFAKKMQELNPALKLISVEEVK